MRTKIILLLLTSVALSTLYACSTAKSNREIFEETLDKNIESCMGPFIEKGVDITSAKAMSRCLFEALFEIDSTYIFKDLDAFKELVNKHSVELEQKCAHLGLWNGADSVAHQ